MEKYYLIPFTEENIDFNGVPFNKVLEELYPELLVLELERKLMLYTTSPVKGMSRAEVTAYNKHIEKTRLYYDTLMVPEYVIARGNEDEAHEIMTGARITARKSSAMEVREVPVDLAKDYYEDSDYQDRISSFFSTYISEQASPFEDTKKLTGYIEGDVDGISISGKFSGTLTKRKKTTN